MKTIEKIRLGVHEGIAQERYSQEMRDLVNSMLNVNADLRPNIDEILQSHFLKGESERISKMLQS